MKAIDGEAPQALTTALFLTFVFIADAQGSLTSREVERLNELLADPGWLDDALLRAALTGLGTHYTALWKAYDAGSFTRERQSLAAELARALSGMDASSAASVRAALLSFAQRIADSGSPILARLGVGAAARARQTALLDFEQLLSGIHEEFEPPTVAAETVAATRRDVIENSAAAGDLSRWPAAQLEFSQENIWKRGRTRVRCVRVTPETHDVKTFTFVTDPPRVFSYKPGQFITLEVPISIAEAVLGGKVEVPTLSGDRLTVKVPPGTSSGAKIRLKGKGIVSGDQFLVMKIVVPASLDEKSRELIEEFAKGNEFDARASVVWR